MWGYILSTVELGLKIAIDHDKLSAHEALSTMRFKQISEELKSIKITVDTLSSDSLPSLNDIKKFEDRLRTQIVNRHSHITPPNFDAARKIEIDKLYVYPSFTTSKQSNEPWLKSELNVERLLEKADRIVILGMPGGGKSTFANKLCYDLANNPDQKKYNSRFLTPILAILRDYGAQKKEKNISILDYLNGVINSRYQLKAPKNFLDYSLLTGRLLILFDGLDELLDTSYRQEITNDIESFCTLYPSVPILVTSREVGYEQAPLRDDIFDIYRLAPFNEDQVRAYVKNWFDIEADLTQDQKTSKIGAFLKESRLVSDLRSNPLMLSLMCNIYRGENYIPSNRPDVYEKCATMLFERWDKGRGIRVELPIDSHIRPTMMFLAEWIYTNDKIQGGVLEDKLIQKAAEYLHPRRFQDLEEAESVAKEFIDYCRGRAWVFTDTGTTSKGERLYQFTHRTFLEYFTAVNLIRRLNTPTSLLELLLPRISNQEWDIVAQLAFQLLNKHVEDAGDVLLDKTITFDDKINLAEKYYRISFVIRCLSFLVPTPKTISKIISISISNIFEWTEKSKIKKSEESNLFFHDELGETKIESLISNLMSVSVENLKIVRECLQKELDEYIISKNKLKKNIALQMGLRAAQYTRYSLRGQIQEQKLAEYWMNFSNELEKKHIDQINELSKENFWLAWKGVTDNRVTFSQMVNWYGIDFLLRSHRIIFSQGQYLPIIHILIVRSFDNKIDKRSSHLSKFLEALGLYFLESTVMISNTKNFDTHFGWHLRGRDEKKEYVTLTMKQLFGLAICYLILFELDEKNSKNTFNRVKGEKTANKERLVINLFKLYEARVNPTLFTDAEKIIRAIGFQGSQFKFLLNWVTRKNNLTV